MSHLQSEGLTLAGALGERRSELCETLLQRPHRRRSAGALHVSAARSGGGGGGGGEAGLGELGAERRQLPRVAEGVDTSARGGEEGRAWGFRERTDETSSAPGARHAASR